MSTVTPMIHIGEQRLAQRRVALQLMIGAVQGLVDGKV
jgi:hypothetical protein